MKYLVISAIAALTITVTTASATNGNWDLDPRSPQAATVDEAAYQLANLPKVIPTPIPLTAAILAQASAPAQVPVPTAAPARSQLLLSQPLAQTAQLQPVKFVATKAVQSPKPQPVKAQVDKEPFSPDTASDPIEAYLDDSLMEKGSKMLFGNNTGETSVSTSGQHYVCAKMVGGRCLIDDLTYDGRKK